MNKEEIIERKLDVSRILFMSNVPVHRAKIIADFIEDLDQENQLLHNKINKAIEILENWNCPECDKNTMREISFSSNKENVLEILKDSDVDE